MKKALCSFVFGIILVGCVSQPTRISPEIQSLITEAKAGDVEAQFSLGSAYDLGNGVHRSGTEAVKWYRMAADNEHAEAQNSLGSIYQAEKKYKEALHWYSKAAEQDHALAINNLAYLYDLGLGVPQDRVKGSELYIRSAELGWAEAMFNLGQMYGSGQLGKIDLIEGCVWTIRALRYSEGGKAKSRSIDTVNYCKQTLSENDYVAAEQKANAWSPKHVQK